MPDNTILNIVDENDNVVGEATREDIHVKGLLHREVHVWLFNKNGELIFQKRAEDKKTNPGLLDASVGGHVEQGDSYEETAVKETKEETGLDINVKNLQFIAIIHRNSPYNISSIKKINNVIRHIFAYEFNEPIETLKPEEGEIIGFEVIKIDSLVDGSYSNKEKIIPSLLNEEGLEILKKIRNLIKNTI